MLGEQPDPTVVEGLGLQVFFKGDEASAQAAASLSKVVPSEVARGKPEQSVPPGVATSKGSAGKGRSECTSH